MLHSDAAANKIKSSNHNNDDHSVANGDRRRAEIGLRYLSTLGIKKNRWNLTSNLLFSPQLLPVSCQISSCSSHFSKITAYLTEHAGFQIFIHKVRL